MVLPVAEAARRLSEMRLYEIDAALEALIDPETGEIADFEAFESLSMARDEKIEAVACWVKNLLSDAAAIKSEESALAERRKTAENRAASLKEYLARSVGKGQKFSTPRCALTWRRSEAVELSDDAKLSDKYLTYKEPEPNKKAIKEAIKSGLEVPGARLVERKNLQIK